MANSLIPLGNTSESLKGQEYLVIAQEGQFFGIDMKHIIELIEQPKVQSIPDAPEFITGVLNLRGEILSVLDLEAALWGENLTRRTQPSKYTGVIMNINAVHVCFLVPEVLGSFTFTQDQLTEDFPLYPDLHSTSSIRAIALTPLEDPETEEIVKVIDAETLFSNRYIEWDRTQQEKPRKLSLSGTLSGLTEEEIAHFDLMGSENYFEQQERLTQPSSPLPVVQTKEISASQEYLVIVQAGQFFGIDAKHVIELIERPQVQVLPNLPEYTRGVLNLRGEILSVLDLEAALWGESPTQKTQSNEHVGVILAINEVHVSILVPEVLGIFAFTADQLTEEFPFIPGLHYTSSIHALVLTPLKDPENEEIVTIIDIETLYANCHGDGPKFPQEELTTEFPSLPKREKISQIETVEAQEYLILHQKDRFFGINTEQIIELIEHPLVQPLPDAPEFIAGALNLRGEILSIMDLEAALWGESPIQRTQSSKYTGVIMNINDEHVSFLVPEVLGVFAISQDQLIDEFPFIPELHSTSSIHAIALAPLNNPEKEEIIEVIDAVTLFSNRYAEWNRTQQEKPCKLSLSSTLSGLTEEEIAHFDLMGDDSYFEQQERLANLKLDDFLLTQIGDCNLSIPLPFIQQVYPTSVVRTNEDIYPVLGWMTLEDTQIPVIDPRDILFVESPPPRPANYAVFTISSEHTTLAIVADQLQAIVKATMEDYKKIQDELKQFEYLNSSLVENIAYHTFDEEEPPLPVLNISKLIRLLLDNENVTNSLKRCSEHKNDVKGKHKTLQKK